MSYIEIFGTLKDASFKSSNLSAYDYFIYDVKKPLQPKQKVTTIDIENNSGLIVSNKKFVSHELTLYGFMETTNYAALKTAIQTLSAFLYSDTEEELIISDENDRYWLCQYVDYEIIGERDNYTLINLTFTCYDPFAYAITADTCQPDNSPAGVVTTNDDTFIVANSGHTYAYPVITITFNQAQTHIYIQNNSITDNRINISNAFELNDELEIDCKNRTVKLNSAADYTGLGDGGDGKAAWIELITGNNEIQVGTDDADINIDIDITFNKTYLY